MKIAPKKTQVTVFIIAKNDRCRVWILDENFSTSGVNHTQNSQLAHPPNAYGKAYVFLRWLIVVNNGDHPLLTMIIH
jgi:hypothetical protein